MLGHFGLTLSLQGLDGEPVEEEMASDEDVAMVPAGERLQMLGRYLQNKAQGAKLCMSARDSKVFKTKLCKEPWFRAWQMSARCAPRRISSAGS